MGVLQPAANARALPCGGAQPPRGVRARRPRARHRSCTKERDVNDTGVPRWQLTHHARVDPHGRARSVSDVILGAQDGVVNVLGVLLGVSAASGSPRLAVAAALAAAFAES